MADILRDLSRLWLADSAGITVMLRANGDAQTATAPKDQRQMDLIVEELETIRASVAAISAMLGGLSDQVRTRPATTLPITRIIAICADAWYATADDILSDRRNNECTLARQSACWFAREYTRMTYKQIAAALAVCDHSTVLRSIARCNMRRKESASYRATFEEARAAIEAEIEAMK